MKKLVVFLALIVVATISQPALGQTANQKKQLNLIEEEIDDLKSEIRKDEKQLKAENRKEQIGLQRKLREAEMKADPRRAKNTDAMAVAKTEAALLRTQIDSMENVLVFEDSELNFKRQELDGLVADRKEMLTTWLSEEEVLPEMVTDLKRHRYQNSNVVEREELVINKIKNNLNGAVDPAGSDGGYKVIFDNKYLLPTTFILQGIDGSEKLAVALGAKTRETHYVLPGHYQVKYIVNGRRSKKVDPLFIDGSKHFYESEPCFGFVYKSR